MKGKIAEKLSPEVTKVSFKDLSKSKNEKSQNKSSDSEFSKELAPKTEKKQPEKSK